MNKKKTEQIINSLISEKQDNQWIEAIDYIEANKDWLDKSAKIAIKVIRALRKINWSQKDLAIELGVSAQQVNKILKGRENLSLKSVSKIEKVLGIELLNVISQAEIQEEVTNEISKQKRIWQKSLKYVQTQNQTSLANELYQVKETYQSMAA